MIIDEIKKQNMIALKEKDTNARSIYSILMSKYMAQTIEARAKGEEIGDVEMVKIIQKTIKELTEEAENYNKVGNAIERDNILAQKSIIEKYLPSMLSEEEIRKIIEGLEDKTVPSVMRYFKTNYNGKCEMKTVSDVLKSI
ncbi:MAG: GatB/YqeY domain-containing protein [Clostridia bacterium]|nr:GatB/YqeY domain-containing protein [Clostridia bacterium]